MDGFKRAEAFLKTLDDPALYEQMLQTLVRGFGQVICQTDDALLVHCCRGNIEMIAARSREAALKLCSFIPKRAENIELHGLDRETAGEICRRTGFRNVIEFVLYAHYAQLPPQGVQAEIRTLTMEDVDFLRENYTHSSREYLAQRVSEGVMLGAYVGGRLAGFIGEHEEGAIGLLHVLPEYRRMGLGYALERAAIARTMAQGYVPFAQVVPGNEASHRLQGRLGFTRSKGTCYWMTNDEF